MEALQWFKTDSGGSDRLKRQPRGVTQLTSGCCVSIYREQPHGKLGRGRMCLINNGFTRSTLALEWIVKAVKQGYTVGGRQ